MEKRDRDHILSNMEKLINLTEYNLLMEYCLNIEMLTPIMKQICENIDDPDLSEKSDEEIKRIRHKNLFTKITKRGPDAYKQLKKICSELNWESALQLLNQQSNEDHTFISLSASNGNSTRTSFSNGNESAMSSRNSIPAVKICTDGCVASKVDADAIMELEEYKGEINGTSYGVIKSENINGNSNCYTMCSKNNRGVLFMVNIINFPNKEDFRNGADTDGNAMLYLFKELGFKLYYYINLTSSQFYHLLETVLKSEDAKKTECFVMALMTHGDSDANEAERVQFADGSIEKVSDIKKYFENSQCPNLLHKPKILVFPFCRGKIADYGQHKEKLMLRQTRIQTDSITYKKCAIVPTLSDIMTCYASVNGFKTHRDPHQGSWYIQMFCEIMSKNAHNTHFEDIVKHINLEVGKLRTSDGAMQTGSYSNDGFNYHLYFNPGVWSEIDNC